MYPETVLGPRDLLAVRGAPRGVQGWLALGLQTIPNENDVTGFVSANQADGSVYCDFLADGARPSLFQTPS